MELGVDEGEGGLGRGWVVFGLVWFMVSLLLFWFRLRFGLGFFDELVYA